MNLRIAFVLAALLAFCVCPAQQVTKEQTMKSREILQKARMLDHLTHLLPLLLTKTQINSLLSAIEKARAKEDQITLNEHRELLKMESMLDEQIKRGVEKRMVPEDAKLKETAKTFSAFDFRRMAAAEENATELLAAVKKIFNAGQLKVAENTLDPKAFDPKLKPDEMSQDEKLKFFIKAVLMDWTSYDVLVKMAKYASD